MGITIHSVERFRAIATDYSQSDKLWLDERVFLRLKTAGAGLAALGDSFTVLEHAATITSRKSRIRELKRAGKFLALAVSAFVLGMISPTAVLLIQKQLGLQTRSWGICRKVRRCVGGVVSCLKPVAAAGLLFAVIFAAHRGYHYTAQDRIAFEKFKGDALERFKFVIDPTVAHWKKLSPEAQAAAWIAGKVSSIAVAVVPTTMIGFAIIRTTANVGAGMVRRIWNSI